MTDPRPKPLRGSGPPAKGPYDPDAIRERIAAERARPPQAEGLRAALRLILLTTGGETVDETLDRVLAALRAEATREAEGLDVERLARAYAEAGYGPVLTSDEWADVAAEYARLATPAPKP